VDDQLLEKFLSGGPIAPAELHAAIRKGTCSMAFVPVLCGSSFHNKGVQTLLDAVVRYLPSPVDVAAIEGIEPESGAAVTRSASDEAPFSALVFKIMTDPFVGHLAFARVYSGRLQAGSQVYNPAKRQSTRVGRLLKMHANKREDIDELWAGDIAAIVGLRNAQTGDTICDPDHPVLLERMEFPDVIRLRSTEDKADQGSGPRSRSSSPKTRPSEFRPIPIPGRR
jgi:elongation factor G